MLLSAPAATEDEREDNLSLPGSSLCLPTNPQCHSDGGRWCRFQTLGSCNHISCDQCQESGYKIHQVKYYPSWVCLLFCLLLLYSLVDKGMRRSGTDFEVCAIGA